MILRRVIAHFRRQEWTAIALDFLIVVVGVFIGLQVNAWNETRLERAKERQILIGLSEDFAKLEESVVRGVEFHKRAVAGMQAIGEALENGNLQETDRPLFEDGLRYAVRNAVSATVSGTLTEILSSGRLGLLREKELRRALAEYEAYQESAKEAKLTVRLIMVQYQRDFSDQYMFDVQSNRPGTYDESAYAFELSEIGAYDFEKMASSPEFRSAANYLRELQLFFLQWEEGSLRHIRSVREILARQLLQTEAAP
jgi:hypothetical protein